MAAKSTLVNMVLCLTGVCLVCAAVLGCIYSVTSDPIAAAADKALKSSIGKVLPEGGSISDAFAASLDGREYEYYVQSGEDGNALSYAVKSVTIGFGGPLTVMVGVLPDGTVNATQVLSHSETPGLGAKCKDDEKFLSQFRSFAPDRKLAVTKDGGEVDAITASTITSRAYTLAVANAVNLVRSIVQGEPDGNISGGQDNE